MKDKLCNFKNIYKMIFEFEHKVKEYTGHSINELLILCTLSHGKSTTGELSEEMGVTPGRISKIISALEKDELISRELGEKDKRHMYFRITDSGKQVMENFKNSGIEIPNIYLNNSTGGNNE